MRFASFCASVKNIHSLGRLLTAFRLWTRETTVSSHNTAETSLTPAKFRSSLLLHSLNCMHCMLTSRWTVTLDLTWHFDHDSTLSIRPTRDGYLGVPHSIASKFRYTASKTRGDIMNIRDFSRVMDEMLQALLLFWIPVSIVPLGLWYSLTSSPLRGRFLAFLGIVLICLSPWTVPSSPSSAAGHLLGAVIGPCMLIIIGIYLISFSGNVPVGKLPRSDRRID